MVDHQDPGSLSTSICLLMPFAWTEVILVHGFVVEQITEVYMADMVTELMKFGGRNLKEIFMNPNVTTPALRHVIRQKWILFQPHLYHVI